MSERKRALRAELIAVRARMTPEARTAKSLALAERADALAAVRAARILAVYAPLGTEADPGEVARRAAERGAVLVYPRAARHDRRLSFARAEPSALVRGPVGALEPPEGAPEVPLADVDCVLVPCVAFSPDGVRLGRGGGYYDATLSAMVRAFRVGIGFEAQLVPELPREPHDALLDAIVTEERVLELTRDPGPRPGASAT